MGFGVGVVGTTVGGMVEMVVGTTAPLQAASKNESNTRTCTSESEFLFFILISFDRLNLRYEICAVVFRASTLASRHLRNLPLFDRI
jgi:hypothetical protein